MILLKLLSILKKIKTKICYTQKKKNTAILFEAKQKKITDRKIRFNYNIKYEENHCTKSNSRIRWR